MTSQTIKPSSTEHFPGNQFEPKHTRVVYRDDDGIYVGITLTGPKDQRKVEVSVTAPSKFEATRKLQKKTNEHFRALREGNDILSFDSDRDAELAK